MPSPAARPLRVVFVGHAAVVADAVRLGGHEFVACVVTGTTPLRDAARAVRARLRPARRTQIEQVARRQRALLIRLRESGDWSRVVALRADVLVCAGFPRRIPAHVLEAFPLGGVNVHPSLLPAHRGPRPVERTILAGDAMTGVTIHRLTADFDAGPIVWSCESAVVRTESCAVLTQRLIALAAAAMPGVLEALRADPSIGRAQAPSPLERRPSRAELRPELTRSADGVRRRILAANGGRFVDERGGVVVVCGARAPSPKPSPRMGEGAEAEVGTETGVGIAAGGGAATGVGGIDEVGRVVAQNGREVLVVTGDGQVWLTLEREPRRRLVWLRGDDA